MQSYAATIYTDPTSFLDQVDPGYYLSTFDGLPSGVNLGRDLSFSADGYSYLGITSGGPFGNPSLYSSWMRLANHNLNIFLSTNHQAVQIELDFSSNVTAIGGTFFMFDGNDVNDGLLFLTLADGTQVQINDGTPFYGFTSSVPITSLILTGNRNSTIDNLYVGSFVGAADVPEPGTVALLGIGLGLILLSPSKRGFSRWQGAKVALKRLNVDNRHDRSQPPSRHLLYPGALNPSSRNL